MVLNFVQPHGLFVLSIFLHFYAYDSTTDFILVQISFSSLLFEKIQDHYLTLLFKILEQNPTVLNKTF